jgi:PAS domain S-box-containing protein
MREEGDVNVKNQLLLICQGTSIGIIVGFISDIVLPFIFGINVLRIGISSSAFMSTFVFLAVYKYNFLSISVEEAASYLFTNVKDSIILFNRSGYIIQANKAAIDLLDLKLSEKPQKIFRLFDGYSFREDYKDYETKISINNDERAVSISQAVVKNRDVELGRILIVRDVTESKKAEKELKDSKVKLERLAGELAQANISLELKVVERTKSLLMSNEQLLREIAERKRAEEALAAEKERLAVTLGSIGDGVITTDTTGNIVLLNQVAEQLTGWPHAEAVGQPLTTVFRIVDEKTRGPCDNPVEEALHTNDVVNRTHHTILRARDQVERLVAESAAPIRTQNGKVIGVVLVFRDMTERRRIEEELVKADKLESIGVLAGGIAHDFNNILMAIIGNTSLAKMYARPDDEKVYTRLINAEKAVLQAQNLTQQLLTFSKGGSLVRKPSSIVELIKDAIDFSLRGSNVRCELFTEENIYSVEVDEGQIGQVINNLIINADQAMPDGGVIEVHVQNVTVESGNTDPLLPLQKGQYVRIAVTDQGIGIPEEDLSKIFDPYFTTKKKGSGLGLFTCYSIIKKHDGHIAVESHRSTGTTFYVHIPASYRQVHRHERQTPVHSAGHGKILVMEDEESIRDVTGEMLRHFGYEVAFAREGAEAIEMYKHAMDAGQPFDVLIMDLTIPGGMGGKEAVRKILDIDPQAKAVVATGYANDPIIADFRQHGFCDRIAKPYKSEELHGILHRVITGTSA